VIIALDVRTETALAQLCDIIEFHGVARTLGFGSITCDSRECGRVHAAASCHVIDT
jgi:hypothetical protein